jgi:hypothetical protein
MPDKDLKADIERILATLVQSFADEGRAREVALLALSRQRITQTSYDNWDGGQYGYTVYLEVPGHLYAQVGKGREEIERCLKDRGNDLTRMYPSDHFDGFELVPELADDPDWREKAKTWVTGQGVNNQGRVRSDNLAPRMVDGLLFRSQPEINLYRALKAAGVSFAPLPVFVRGGQTYKRIEPDFVIIKDGIVMVVEVDGDTVHRETPREAHDRLTMLAHEGVHVERVNAAECETADLARQCAAKILRLIEKLKTNK